MPKVELKRSLFIGLGGTGAAALLETKKRFLDTYGEIPPMISFLAIDTDFNTNSKSVERENILKEHKDQRSPISLDNSELLYTNVQGAQAVYTRMKDNLFNWMPEKNEHVIRNMLNGAGQVRTNGRFALHFNYRQIISSVQSKIINLLDINIPEESNFVPKGNGIEINFVFSVSGGTGSGTFVDIAYLIKEAIGNANNTTTIAFVVLPDIFNAIQSGPSMMNVRPNTYGALKDLDFLMSKNIHKLGLELLYEDKTINIDTNPFDVVFTVNNKNTAGETILGFNDVTEQIGLAMFTGASQLSSDINSAYDNVMTVMSGGTLDVENKRAWAGGMGVSELFYDGNTLANIYANKAIASIITNLTTASNDSQKLADQFIDSDVVSIRENDGSDNLIDSLLSKTSSTFSFEIESTEDLMMDISNHFKNFEKISEDKIKENYQQKLDRVKGELHAELMRIINKDSGVANAAEFLQGLIVQLNIFFSEMQEEENEFKNNRNNLDQTIEDDLKYLSSLGGWSDFFKRSEIKTTKEAIENSVNKKLSFINEILRRQYAQKFINSLKKDVDTYKNNVDTIIKRLNNVKASVLQKAAEHQNSINERRRTFVIDLHKNDINNIYVSRQDYVVLDLLKGIRLVNKLYDFYDIGEKVIEDHLWGYTKQLPEALKYVNRSIDDIFRELPEEKNKEIAKQLISRSNALWNYDFKGYKVGGEIHDDFVIGLPSLDSKFKESFDTLINARNIKFVSTGLKNKVVCYRMEVAVPIYAVHDMEGYEKDYTNSRICHHIDANWLTKMERMNFSIWPEKKEDHSLEAWVLGFVYKLIKFEDGKYKIYSLDKGDALDDYWTDLSEYRDEAFDTFKKEGYIEEIINQVEGKRTKAGEDETQRLLKDVIESYKDQYSQINLTVEEMKKREFSKIADLLRSEINFTKKELVKQIK